MLFSPPTNGAEADSRRSRILLVEDHALIQDAVANILRGRCYIVGIIDRGDAVLAAIQNVQPEAVILDISLPDMSGMQVLEEIRIQFPRVAIVMLTTNIEPIYRQEALARGAHEFVSKLELSIELSPAIERAVAAVRASNPRHSDRTKA